MLLAASRALWRGRCLPASTLLISLLCLAAATLLATDVHAVGASSVQAEEYRLKAAFIYRFPQFIEWPDQAWTGRSSVDLCIVRPDPFGAILPELLKGEAINGRPLRVRHLDAGDSAAGCHVVVAAGAAGRRGEALLKRLAGRPVLTIGDDSSFLADGGIIVMKIIDSRVRFEVSLTNARRAGLQINSQLLRLALAVHGGQP